MELASRCPAEIPHQFNQKRVENSVQKGTVLQVKQIGLEAGADPEMHGPGIGIISSADRYFGRE